MMGDKTFIKVTNQDIYDKLCSLETHVIETNGKVKLNRWISSTGLAGVFGLVGFLASRMVW